MRVLGLRWVGIQTEAFDETARFARDVLGLSVRFEEAGTVEFAAADGAAMQIFGAGHRYFDFFRAQANGPVPLFEVDDLAAAWREVELAGMEIVGEPDHDSSWQWIHVRGPDGNLYELASRMK